MLPWVLGHVSTLHLARCQVWVMSTSVLTRHCLTFRGAAGHSLSTGRAYGYFGLGTFLSLCLCALLTILAYFCAPKVPCCTSYPTCRISHKALLQGGPSSAIFLLPRSLSRLHPSAAMLGTAVRLSVLLSLFNIGKGQIFHMGPCPDPSVQEEFDINKV